MVCISCIVIPVVLFLWHRFLQPIVMRFWNPWAKVEDKKTADSDGGDDTAKLLKCPISNGNKSEEVKDKAD